MKSSMIDLGSVQIRVLETGFSDKPQLVCVHGGMGLGLDSLTTGLEGLSRKFDLLFVDLRGAGLSSESKDGTYSLGEYVDDLSSLLERAPRRSRGIFGHSLGGMIGLELLAVSPSLAQFAILSNSAANDGWRETSSESVKKIQTPALTSALQAYSEAPTGDDTTRRLAIEYAPLYFPELTIEHARRQMEGFTYRGAAMQYTSAHVYPGMNLEEKARAVRVPTLVIGGEVDAVVPSSSQRELAQLIPNSQLCVVPGAGHFPFLTKKNEFTVAVEQWFDEQNLEDK